MQVNALYRLQKYMGKTEKIFIINNFTYFSFNYYPLVWRFCSCQSSKKIENIQKHCLRFVLNDHESDNATLLKKKNTTTMEIKSYRNI